MHIFAGTAEQFSRDPEDWILVDSGFSGRQASGRVTPSTGLRLPVWPVGRNVSWSEAKQLTSTFLSSRTRPINVMLEAPLSVAFSDDGNPAPRAFEKSDNSSRYWYLQGGAVTLVSAAYMIGHWFKSNGPDLHLFEAFLSFKNQRQDHSDDANDMLEAALTSTPLSPAEMVQQPTDKLQSSTLELGLDFGVPPVFVISPRTSP